MISEKNYLLEIMTKYLTNIYHDDIGISKAMISLIRVNFIGTRESAIIELYSKCNFLDMTKYL